MMDGGVEGGGGLQGVEVDGLWVLKVRAFEIWAGWLLDEHG